MPNQTQISKAIFWLGFVAMATVICVRYGRDGSFWLDEASVALSFKTLALPDVFDRLVGSQSFPRPYFLLIMGTQQIFGYETAVLRFFPVAFGLAASFTLLRLFRLRFAAAPALLVIAVLLNLIPSSWFTYSALLKQYSLDVLLALVPFCLPDSFYDKTLLRGRSPGKLALLVLPCATSYTYIIPLLGRIIAWWLSGLSTRGSRPSPRGMAVFAAALAVAMTSLYWTDLRFTLGQEGVVAFHAKTIIGNDWSHTGRILQRLLIGWYTGKGEFHVAIGPPLWFLHWLVVFSAIGVARLLWEGVRLGRSSQDAPPEWGSRSLGSLATVVGFLIASPLMQYPANESRMTLFLLFHLQILLLEGISLVGRVVDSRLRGRIPGVRADLAIFLALALMLAPAAVRNVTGMIRHDAPTNIRPVLPLIAQHPELTIFITPCTVKQVESLPEGLGNNPIRILDFGMRLEDELPSGEEVLVLNAFDSRYCRGVVRRIRELSSHQQQLHNEHHDVDLWLVRIPERS